MRSGARWWCCVWCTGAAALAISHWVGQGRAVAGLTGNQIAAFARRDERLDILLDANREPASRTRAAESLASAPGDSVNAVASLLTPEAEPGARDMLITALARCPTPDESLQAPLLKLLESTTSPSPAMLQAVASFRSREGAAALLRRVSGGPTDADVFSALRRLTGAVLPDDAGQWSSWLSERRSLTQRDWEREVAGLQAERARSEAAARAAAVTKLVDLYKRLLAAKPTSERSPVLEEMVQSPEVAVRLAAFELAHWELQSGRQIAPAFASLAVEQLKSPAPAVRSEAAKLINRIGFVDARAALLSALDAETDPSAAASMLACVAQRWPSPLARGAVMRWLKAPGAAGEAARRAALALHKAGHLDDPADRDAVLEILRAFEPSQLQESGLRLLGMMGTPDDRRAISELLVQPGAVPAAAVASIVASWPESLGALARTAQADPSVYGAWAEALATHRPSSASFSEFLRVSPPDPDLFLRCAERFAARMSPEDLVESASLVGYACRVRMLQNLVMHTGVEAAQETVGEGLLDLSEAAIATRETVMARAALTAIPEASGAWTSERAEALRILVCDTSAEFDSVSTQDASTWVEAVSLGLLLDPARAARLISQVQARFGSSLSKEQESTLAAMSVYLIFKGFSTELLTGAEAIVPP